jgi:protein gp37
MSTSIEWCDEVWNPVLGCTRVSAGCDHCYAMGVAHRKMSPQHVGLTKLRPKDARRPGVDWTGEVRTLPERLGEPLRWRKSRRVFVNSMSDLFHPIVPFEFIAAVFGVCASTPHHTYLMLTKRDPRPFYAWMDDQAATAKYASTSAPHGFVAMDAATRLFAAHELEYGRLGGPGPWPLPNVHIGVSAEDQATFEERVPPLLQCPAAVRWVSAEPLLGPIEMRQNLPAERTLRWYEPMIGKLDWIVVGGESGPGARPNVIDWTRAIIGQCRDAGVPVFHKQVGARPYDALLQHGNEWPTGDDGVSWRITDTVDGYARVVLRDRKGGDMAEWPNDLKVRELPEVRT